ncbi:hypothetical protein L6227_15105 [Pseudomonas syringae pv. syringae]|uniref:hypothetical protein n=1 Tax=Pseudomonas syringae TaxID=317 RepID=UPI001F0E8E54|nr:hypothetical protein [Pseudomonas syringae]MCH5550607.1 hypothetical protein [Pseudomonas syringae pv. syringae]
MKPTDTAEFIGELNAGIFANQIGHALSEVADSHQVTVNNKLAYKVPTKRGSRSEDTTLDTAMYVGEDRNAAPAPAGS